MLATTKNIINSNKNNLLAKKLTNIALAGLLTLSCSNAAAMDATFSLHKGDESKTAGFNLALSDSFSKGSNFYWTVAYNSLTDVKADVDQDIILQSEDDLFFNNNTIEALVSYRQKVRSYNEFFKKLTIEYQIGASISLTDNKYVWQDPELEGVTYEEYVSESADINPVLSIASYYHFNKNTAVVLGVKYQPSFSNLGDVGSIFLGFNYTFGKVVGY